MSQQAKNEKPEVYALRQDEGKWQINRRDFLKAAGLGAAVIGVGLNARFVKPAYGASNLDSLCKSAPAHQNTITGLLISADGKYLVSRDKGNQQKCWEFGSHALLKSAKSSVSGEKLSAAAALGGTQMALLADGSTINLTKLPDLGKADSVKVSPSGGSVKNINSLVVDTKGNIYGADNSCLFLLTREGSSYTHQEVLYKAGSGALERVEILAEGNKLFVLKESGYGVFSLQDKTMQDHDSGIAYSDFAILPGGTKALLCGKNNSEYSLVSLKNGETLWKKSLNQNAVYAALTPDGSYGILSGEKNALVLISMDDGSEIRRISVENAAQTPVVVSKTGESCAVASDKSILFISLPDFGIIGCPVDLSEMKDTSKGIEVKKTDPVTGHTVTYTLPCGAPIPEGAVCVCNCVAGEVCSCVGHVVPTYCSCDTVCSCVGNTYTYCSCDTVCTCEGDGHYWYPD